MAELSTDDILKLARLSKLELTQDQIEQYRTEIGNIMSYVEQLQSVDINGLQPTNQVTGLTNVTRPDEITGYAKPADLLKNVPKRDGDYIKVNRMIG